MRNLKKILALVLALVMSLSLMAVASADEELNLGDVSDVYAESVDVLTGLKVFMGNKGEFLPKDNITRAEVAAIIYRIVTGDVNDTQKAIYADYNKFSDVTSDAWYAGYVNYCANAEYVKGVGGGKFNPQGNVTGYEALAMILRAIGYDKNNEFTGSNWQIQTAATARNRGILENIAEGTLGGAAHREVVAEILCKTILVPVADYTLAFGYRTTDANGNDNPTLAYTTFKMEKQEGVVTANEYASLTASTPVAAGQTTLKLSAGDKRTMNVGSNLDDLGESRYIYVIPQSGTTRYDLVCSKVYNTGKNNVYDSGDAVTSISNSTAKDNGITDISSAVYLRNYGELTSDVSDWRIEYVLRLNCSTYEAMSMYYANGKAANSYLFKLGGWDAAKEDYVREYSIDMPKESEYINRSGVYERTTARTEKVAGGWSHIDGSTTNFTYEYRRVIPLGTDITSIDKDNIKTIFTKSSHLVLPDGATGNSRPYDLGEVYVGTSTIVGKDDVSNTMSHAEFITKYLKGQDDKITSNGLGNRLKIVDNNNDGVAEYILQTVYTVAIASNVDANGKISLDIMNADFDSLSETNVGVCHSDTLHNVNPYNHKVDSCNEITSTTKTAVYGDGEVSTGTVVLYAYIDGTAQMEPAAGETVKFNKVVRTDRTATTTDEVEYKESAVHEHSTSLTHTVANLVTNTTYTVYFDKYGNLAAFTEGANGEFTLITDGWYNNLKGGAEYAARVYNDETASIETVDITGGGSLFIGNDYSNNNWGNLKFFESLNDDGKTTNADSKDDIHTTVAVLENGVLTPVDKVYRYGKQNAMIEMDKNAIPGRDNQSESKGWVWNTAYGADNDVYNSRVNRDSNTTKDAADRFDVRGLSTTKYYYVYNFQTRVGSNQITQAVRVYTGYAGLPSIPNALIEDVYAVGTLATDAAGQPYYTADVVVVELNDNYNGSNRNAEQVFIPQFATVGDGIGIEYIDMIRENGEVQNIRVDLSASKLRWYDEAGIITENRGNRIAPGLYYMEKVQNTEDTYSIRYMTRSDIQNSGKYAIGYINKAAASDPANWTGVDRMVWTGIDVNGNGVGNVGDWITSSGNVTGAGATEFARITNGVGHYYTLSYDDGRVAHLIEDRGTVMEQNPFKDAKVLDTKDIWVNETSFGTLPHRNEVLMAYNGSNVTYMISFNEYENPNDLTRDFAQTVWASLMPTSYTADSNTEAPSLTFYGQPVNSNPFNVPYEVAKDNPNTIVINPGTLANFDANKINSVVVYETVDENTTVVPSSRITSSNGVYTVDLGTTANTAKTWTVDISYNNGADIAHYVLNRLVASNSAQLTGNYVTQPEDITPATTVGKIEVPVDTPIDDYMSTFGWSARATVVWTIEIGDTAREVTGTRDEIVAEIGKSNTNEIVTITAKVTAENGTTTTIYQGGDGLETLKKAITAAETALNNWFNGLSKPQQAAAQEQFNTLMGKVRSAASRKQLSQYVTLTPNGEESGFTGSVNTGNDEIKDIIDTAEEADPTPYTTLPAPGEDGVIKLEKDAKLSGLTNITEDTTIDLNGHNISREEGKAVFNVTGGKLTLAGEGTVSVTAAGVAPIYVQAGCTGLNIGEKVTLSTGTDDASFCIVISENAANTVIDMNGKMTGQNGLSTNGRAPAGNNVTINVGSTANITVNATGLYLAGPATTNVNGATISGINSGIEIRAGVLHVKGGSISSRKVGVMAAPVANGNGTTMDGVALAVSPHGTEAGKNITVTVEENAVLSGPKQIALVNTASIADLTTRTVTVTGCSGIKNENCVNPTSQPFTIEGEQVSNPVPTTTPPDSLRQ